MRISDAQLWREYCISIDIMTLDFGFGIVWKSQLVMCNTNPYSKSKQKTPKYLMANSSKINSRTTQDDTKSNRGLCTARHAKLQTQNRDKSQKPTHDPGVCHSGWMLFKIKEQMKVSSSAEYISSAVDSAVCRSTIIYIYAFSYHSMARELLWLLRMKTTSLQVECYKGFACLVLTIHSILSS